jgi:UDP-4-amino-4-deoxy-L-arabinose formyltransferase/UDP-glucuronic acid dehydrogenase (UDP-4-keto-hexauronic acid decarboxylating)
VKIYILNTLAIGLDTVDILQKKIPLKGVVGLSNRESNEKISDFVYQKPECDRRKIDFTEVGSYDLSSKEDKCKLLKLEIDVLIVAGWQRLIPKWLIDHCRICAIGSHGSPHGITKGRGRSPQNWALLLGCSSFEVSIFEIDEGVDSGRVIDTRSFEYSQYDTIKTSYYKVSLLTSEMIFKALKSPDFRERKFLDQCEGNSEYLPQRKPKDGEIDWFRSSLEITNFIRAISKPYPGAYTYFKKCKIKLWSAIPFSIDIESNCSPGEILKIFNKRDILVKTLDGFVLIDDFEFDSKEMVLEEGSVFSSCNFSEQMKEIIHRHEKKYPNFPISSSIIKYDD